MFCTRLPSDGLLLAIEGRGIIYAAVWGDYVMCRWMLLVLVASAGCSTHPVADFLDIVKPAPQMAPIAAMASPRIPTSARYRALPVPSMTSPWMMRMSYVAAVFAVAALVAEGGAADVQVRARKTAKAERICKESSAWERGRLARS